MSRFLNRKVVIDPAKEMRAPVLRSADMARPDAMKVEMHRVYPVSFMGDRVGYLYRNIYGNHAWVYHPVLHTSSRKDESSEPVLMGMALSADEAKRTCMALVEMLLHPPEDRPKHRGLRLLVCRWCGAAMAYRLIAGALNSGPNWCWRCGSTAQEYERLV